MRTWLCPNCSGKLASSSTDRCTQCGARLRIGRYKFTGKFVHDCQQIAARHPGGPEAVWFLVEAFYIAIDRSIDRRRTNAALTCEAVVGLAKRRFGLDAASKLQSWGIHGSEDVGKFALELHGIGFFPALNDGFIESFNGIFKTIDILHNFGRCGNCDYDLRGLRAPRCPECGWEQPVFSA